jgi:hypothetical protein
MPDCDRKDTTRSISGKQLAANRRNATLSTGPRTDAGKQRSAMNAFKHPELGLTALMTEEDSKAQTEFIREYIADWDPRGAIDVQMARTLAMDNWRINRIKAVEENIFAWGHEVDNSDCCHSDIPQIENALTHAVSYMQYADRINKISLYESRLSRIIARNMDILNKRQADRRDRVKPPEAAPIAEPLTQTAAAAATAVNEPVSRTEKNQPLERQNGFDQTDPPPPQNNPVEAPGWRPGTTGDLLKAA